MCRACASLAVPAVARILASTARGCWAVIAEMRVKVAMTPQAHKAGFLMLSVVTMDSPQCSMTDLSRKGNSGRRAPGR